MTDLVQQSLAAMGLGGTSNIFTEKPQESKQEAEQPASEQVVVEIPKE